MNKIAWKLTAHRRKGTYTSRALRKTVSIVHQQAMDNIDAMMEIAELKAWKEKALEIFDGRAIDCPDNQTDCPDSGDCGECWDKYITNQIKGET